jgi:hypothetical protein
MAGMPIALFLASAFLLSTYAKADTAATEATYKAKCASCHGADGKGKEALKTKDFALAAVQNMQNSMRSSPMEKARCWHMAKAESRIRLRTWWLTFDPLERNNSEPRQEVA